MTFEAFRELVEEMLDEVPPGFTEGLQGVHVLPQLKQDPHEPELVRMGEYLDPGPDSFFGGLPGLGRHVALYYGSFAEVAGLDERFDWEDEAWETLTHELLHHVESRAGEAGRIEQDRLDLERFRRDRLRGRGLA